MVPAGGICASPGISCTFYKESFSDTEEGNISVCPATDPIFPTSVYFDVYFKINDSTLRWKLYA